MCDRLRLYGIVNDAIVDGPGLRLAVFAQGCPHACAGCHNPASHDADAGQITPIAEVVQAAMSNPLLSGVTFTGGEPFLQAEAFAALARALRAARPRIDLWVYSGYTMEELRAPGAPPGAAELLRLCDVLVDGPYIEAERSLSLRYRGSRNQRLIDLVKTFETGETVLWEPAAW